MHGIYSSSIKERIQAGGAKIPSSIVIINGQLVNVHTSEIYPAGVAIYKEMIVATGDVSAYIGESTKVIDAKGAYLVPGLIDGHLHIECSKLSMTRFAQAVIPHGTTSIVSGLDQYLVIAGIDCVKEVLEEIAQSPLKVFWGLPFKTPYTLPESTVGYTVNADTHKVIQPTGMACGVWETVTEFLENEDEGVLQSLEYAQSNGMPIFGCNPMVQGERLNAVLSAGIRLDHESYSKEEALEKVRKGMFILLRESSVSHFLQENCKIITEHSEKIARRVSFCTDDVTALEIAENGHMDKLIRMAIQCGIDPITAIQMGSINSAEAYRIDGIVGSIAPGKIADILFVKDLEEFTIHTVIAKGIQCVDDGQECYTYIPPKRSSYMHTSITTPLLTQESFALRVDEDSTSATKLSKARVLSMEVDYSVPFVRTKKEGIVDIVEGIAKANIEDDILYGAVVGRYGKDSSIGLGFVSGWGLKKGAMASSKAPDDNNIVCIGTNHADMLLAVEHIKNNGGGQAIAVDGEIVAFLPLPICGIVGDYTPAELVVKEKELLSVVRSLGSTLPDPIFYMSCLQITAIPEYALIDKGAVCFSTQSVFNPILEVW